MDRENERVTGNAETAPAVSPEGTGERSDRLGRGPGAPSPSSGKAKRTVLFLALRCCSPPLPISFSPEKRPRARARMFSESITPKKRRAMRKGITASWI